ncbi:hypothetical protein L484_002024 [Morus notabilis]|uniref:Uncharacterized protein n=1 Tax=Morus notabilis TaxID=981085 RepID=W9RPC4_9ROSA|nr:hypothetical protein L484_002024 [Morus notabilis]
MKSRETILVFKYADMDLQVFLGEYATKASDQKLTKSHYTQHLKLLLDFIASSLAAHMLDVGCISAEMPEMVNQKPFFEGKGANINNIFNLLGTPTKENWPGVAQLYEQISDYDKISAKDDEPDNSMLEAPANNGPPSDAAGNEDEEEHKEENHDLDDIDEDRS